MRTSPIHRRARTKKNERSRRKRAALLARHMRMEQLERRDLLAATLWNDFPAQDPDSPASTESPRVVLAGGEGAEGESAGVDYGDAPDGTLGSDLDKDGVDDGVDRNPVNSQLAFASPSYNTLERNNGPSHGITSELFLGQRVDAGAGLPNYSATGDDADSSLSDDDGVIDPARSLQLVEGQQPKVSLTVTNISGKEATLSRLDRLQPRRPVR